MIFMYNPPPSNSFPILFRESLWQVMEIWCKEVSVFILPFFLFIGGMKCQYNTYNEGGGIERGIESEN